MKKPRNDSKKLYAFMKFGGIPITIILLILSCGYGKNTTAQAILEQEITYRTTPTSLGHFLQDIEKSSDIQFTYSIQKIDIAQEVSYPKKTVNLADLLDEVLNPLSIKYHVFNNRNIVLTNAVTHQKQTTGITISGTVHNGNGEPIQFANALIQSTNDNTIPIKGAVTDEFGKFSIDKLTPGEYKLGISFIGYQTVDTILIIEESLEIGVIALPDELNILSGVSVTARRRLIKQEIDRLILDVENSMLAARGNAMDVLASTPSISVKNDQINMIGKSSVGVMVDDKLIDLPSEELANFLRSISSEDIMHIEVISNPPSKYEAEGNSGLVNIVLKKARKNSWNASIRSGYNQQTNGSGNIGATFIYNKNKFSLASSVFFIDGKYYQEQDDYAYFPDGLWYTSSPILSDYRRFNSRLDLSYQLTPNWSIGGQYMINDNNYFVTDNPYTPVFDNETNEIRRYLLSTFSQMIWKPSFNSMNFNSSINIDTTGKKVHFNLDYFIYENEDLRQYVGESVINSPQSMQHYAGINDNMQKVDNMSGSVDFDYPVAWANISFGTKFSKSTSTNDISLFNSGLVSEKVTAMPLDNNDFKYVESIEALYLSIARPINNKWNMQAGIRVEATQTESTSENLQLNETNDYVKVFPTLYVTHNPSDKATYSLSYGRRISRPTFGQLNPNVFFINPFQTIVGNAFLQPSFTDNLDLSIVHGNLSSKLYFSRERDIFAQIPIPNSSNNIITFANENYVNTNRYGLSEFYIFDKISWWTSNNSFDINYSISSFDLETPHADLKGLSSRISTSNDFSIRKIKGLSLNVSYSYSFPGKNFIFDTGKASNLSGSIQYLLLDGKLKLSLSGNDLFKDSAEILEATVNGVFQTARYYYDSRSIYFSASYRFGNKNISAKRHKTGNTEERNRTGN